MKCPRCDTLILAEDVNLDRLLAKCRHCHEVFRFTPPNCPAHAKAADGWPLAKLPRPERLEISDIGDTRQIVRKWFTDAWFLSALFCLVWNGGMLAWFVVAIRERADFWAFACPLPMLAVGWLGVYGSVALLINRTVIDLRVDILEITHGPVPVPWLRPVKAFRTAIDQIYCTYAKVYTSEGTDKLIGVAVNVNLLLSDGGQKLLLADLPSEEGLFIEQQLEEWLEIAPARVPGQVE